VRLLPELLATAVVPAPSWTLSPEQERRLLFTAVGRFLANVAGPAGTLLVLDDLQWAGGDALDLLDSLVRAAAESSVRAGTPEQPEPQCLRIVGAYRNTEVGAQHPLGALHADLACLGLAASRCVLGPLPADDARALAAELVKESGANEADRVALVEQLTRRAGGVPFYLVTCAQAARVAALDEEPLRMGTADGAVSTVEAAEAGGGAVSAVPWLVAETIRQRVAALPEGAGALLGVAAVIGRVVPYALLATVAAPGGRAPAVDFLAALDAACRGHLLEERDAGAEEQRQMGVAAQYQFAHDLIREVVLRDMGAARRIRLHGAVAAALERLPEAKRTHEGRAAQLAYHFQRAEEPARALPYALAAGNQAEAIFAHAEAEQHYRTAVALAREAGEQAREAEALEKLGEVLALQGRQTEAIDLGERALTLFRAMNDRNGELRTLARVLGLQGHAGIPRVLPLLATFEHGEDRDAQLVASGLAALCNSLAGVYFSCGLYEEELAAAVRAERFARAAQDDTLLVRALLQRGLAAGALGESVLELWLDLIPLAQRVDILEVLAHALNNAAGEYLYGAGDFTRATPYLDQALAVAEHRGDPALITHMLIGRASCEYVSGNWRHARECAARAAAITREIDQFGTLWVSCFPFIALGLLDVAEGHDAEGTQRLEQAIVLARSTGNTQALRWAAWPLSERELLAGHASVAYARIRPLLAQPCFQDEVASLLPLKAWAELALGKEEQVGATLAASVASRWRFWQADTFRVQALGAMSQGNWKGAEEALEEALALAHEMHYPYAEAKALYVYGQLEAARGEPERTRERYVAALSRCARLGERLYAERIEQALNDLDET
jgi:tetratricopeptide (TPR) repeat protein